MIGVFMAAMSVQRRANTKEKLKGVIQIVPVIAIEMIRLIVECKLGAESDVEAVAV